MKCILEMGREALGLDPNTDEGRNKLDQLREGIVSELIDRTLNREEAERRGLSIPPERLVEAERGRSQSWKATSSTTRSTRERGFKFQVSRVSSFKSFSFSNAYIDRNMSRLESFALPAQTDSLKRELLSATELH